MIPRLDIRFPLKRQWQYWFGKPYQPKENELLLNHARSGIVLALRACLPNGGRVGVMAYNCHTVANAVVSAGCTPVFVDVTDELTIDNAQCTMHSLDALIVTNLFGIRNDIEAIRAAFPGIPIIVDNAHGYGLPPEGDFTVYSINQGKYPTLGPGGILVLNGKWKMEDVIWNMEDGICKMGNGICKVGLMGQIKEFCSMLMKAILYSRCVYGWFTLPLKRGRANKADHTPVVIKAMSPGVNRLYQAWRRENGIWNMEDGRWKMEDGKWKMFMDVIHTDNPEAVIAEYAKKGIEAETHFKNCINWAREFDYVDGSCPNTERLIHELVMAPNYMKYKNKK